MQLKCVNGTCTDIQLHLHDHSNAVICSDEYYVKDAIVRLCQQWKSNVVSVIN